MNHSKDSDIKISYLIFFISYLTILIGYLLNEDSLGGAKVDFLYHLNIADNFRYNFLETWEGFGYGETGLQTRNSPVFWIIVSFINKFLSIDLIRGLNSVVSILITLFFYKCVCLKFKHIFQYIVKYKENQEMTHVNTIAYFSKKNKIFIKYNFK